MQTDPYKYFRVEARDIVEQIGKSVMEIEKGGSSAAAIACLLRLAHTLKGAARVVKQLEIADHAHAVEDLLEPYRNTAASPTPDCLNEVLSRADAVGSLVTLLSQPAHTEADAAAPPSQAQPDTSFRTLRADVAEMDELLDGIAETHALLGTLRRGVGMLDHARSLIDSLDERPVVETGSRTADPERTLATLKEALAATDRGLISVIDRIDREINMVRDSAERLRLVPAATAFTAIERAARDAAQAQGKNVVFEGAGGDVRVDAHMLDTMQKALLQLVRNAVAHGIESESERKAAGKPRVGRVAVDIARRGNRVAFRCRDDGRGFDLEAVRRAMREKGLPPSEAEALGPAQLIETLMRGGISTSDTVTEVCGRGIGLDIVREVAESLGGDISVHTERGQGSVVEVSVPMALASVNALLADCHGMVVAIPLDGVRSCLWVRPGDIARTAQGDVVLHEGVVLPFIPLARILMLEPAATQESLGAAGTRAGEVSGGTKSERMRTAALSHSGAESLGATGTRAGEVSGGTKSERMRTAALSHSGAESLGATGTRAGEVSGGTKSERMRTAALSHSGAERDRSVIVVHGDHGVAAIGIDRLVGTASIVMRPLPDLAPAIPAVLGASLNAEGNPILVLHADGLVVEAQRGETAQPSPPPATRPILVIDDSLTTRMLEQSILESAGYEVNVATSAEEALEMATAMDYALFLVDVEMPGMDGFTFIEHVRDTAALRDIPAILVTSRASAEDRRRGEEVGARAHVVKSDFNQSRLLAHIRELVGQR